jgi:hypothetical protein
MLRLFPETELVQNLPISVKIIHPQVFQLPTSLTDHL